VRIGFKTSQTHTDWPTLLRVWELGDELTIFDSAWLFDHFVAPRDDGPAHEAWTLLSALATRTTRLQIGHLVLSNTFRHPAVLAKMAASMDHIADGRFVLGLGAGWHEGEHAMYDLPLPPIGERITMLDSAVRVIRAMWDSPNGVSLEAPPFRLQDATCLPAPLTPGGPPIWLGTQGMQRGLRIVAQLADGWNCTGGFASFGEKREALLRHCEAVGRDPSSIEISAQVFDNAGSAAQLAEAIQYVEAGVSHVILIMDVNRGGDGLKRLSREVAEPLRDRFG
jgi:alkanesulfonate monooxygenase SsuD/methylene tetrahydromethanopterin reductase-like flavin-dependent oxidoreductase (luciferase family)